MSSHCRCRSGRSHEPVPDALRGKPFTYAEARHAGVSADRMCGPAFARLNRGVYVEHDLSIDDELSARAWMLSLPDDAAMYGETAAWWYRLPVEPRPVFHIVPPGIVPRRRAGLEPHEGLGPADATAYRGLRVTTPERTWLDLTLSLADVDLVIAADAMIRRGLTTADRLVETADHARRRRGVVRARELARLARAGVDSPPETRLRLLLVQAGLPSPAVNVDVADEFGGWIGRPDLSYPELKISIQYEGDVHRTSKQRWRADIGRDEVLREHGWEVIRVTAEDLRAPGLLCERIRRAMTRQRRRLGLSG